LNNPSSVSFVVAVGGVDLPDSDAHLLWIFGLGPLAFGLRACT
jgi:hypothetical protein